MKQSGNGIRWRRKPPNRPLLFSVSLICISLLFLFFSYSEILKSFFPPSSSGKTLGARFPRCGSRSGNLAPRGERFMWYAPHSGFSNQLAELKNAVLVAAILNRTLVVPPVLDHHAVALGSCPKFRVSSPSKLRITVWDHILELLQSRRYVSMADIVDISSIVSSSMVKAIDFRVFVSMWCGLNMDDLACFGSGDESLSRRLKRCGAMISGLEGNVDRCVYAVEEDCRTTVWTYRQDDDDDGILDSFQPDIELQKKKKISYVRRRRDVYKAFGPGSEAELATILTFGSLFSAPYRGSELYIDIHEVAGDPRMELLLQRIKFLPFVPEITSAGKDFALNQIKGPFLCAQLRLLDGQFKNHWNSTFSALRQKIQSLQMEAKEYKAVAPIHIFIMTDLLSVNWTGSYLAELASNSDAFKLYTLREVDVLVMRTSRKLVAAKHGLLRSGFLPNNQNLMSKNRHCSPVLLPDILLYIEETICSCASLGFVGTAGSTIAESIELMRKYNVCIHSSPS